ncbi:MAG: type II toxin-antitoxin system VapC family toxin [Deltaproteobacteria bacterium]|nr:type II toxin-antitoxin system VapC family toxin [Deltaproteobacteria bacterium]
MIYLFDTDHFSILQRKAGPEYVRLSTWMISYAPSDFACSVVSLHEQVVGAHAFLNQAKNSVGLMRGYPLLERLPKDYLAFTLLPFDAASAAIYDQLSSQNLPVGTMDLRLASIALTRNLRILTRNLRDFSQVPGLHCEDRTAGSRE